MAAPMADKSMKHTLFTQVNSEKCILSNLVTHGMHSNISLLDFIFSFLVMHTSNLLISLQFVWERGEWRGGEVNGILILFGKKTI